MKRERIEKVSDENQRNSDLSKRQRVQHSNPYYLACMTHQAVGRTKQTQSTAEASLA